MSLTLILSRFSAAALGLALLFNSSEVEDSPCCSLMTGTASSFSLRRQLIPNMECSPASKAASGKWSLHTRLELLGPDQSALVNFTFAVQSLCILASFGNVCKLTPSLAVLLHPATMHLLGIFVDNQLKSRKKSILFLRSKYNFSRSIHTNNRLFRTSAAGSCLLRKKSFLKWRIRSRDSSCRKFTFFRGGA